jgi:hypothetical protein
VSAGEYPDEHTRDALDTLLRPAPLRRSIVIAPTLLVCAAALVLTGILLPAGALIFIFLGLSLGGGVLYVEVLTVTARSKVRQARMIVEGCQLDLCSLTAIAAPRTGRWTTTPRAAVRIDSPAERAGSPFLVEALDTPFSSKASSPSSLARRLTSESSMGTYEVGTRPVHATALIAGRVGGPILIVDETFESALIPISPLLPSERTVLRRLSDL